MDITCIKLQLFSNGDDLLMDTSQVIPLPEASDYLVKIRERDVVERIESEIILGIDHFRRGIDDMPEND